MRRFTILLAALTILSSCTPKPETSLPEDVIPEDAFFAYPTEQNINCFTVDEAGFVYTCEVDPETGFAFDDDHNTINSVRVYSMDGALSTELFITLPGNISIMCAANGFLYLQTSAYYQNTLYSYNLTTEEVIKITSFDNFVKIKKITCFGDRLYILGIHKDYTGKDYDEWEGDYQYNYDGTVLAAYDIASDTLEIVFDETADNFALNPDGTIVVLAHDGTGGFYFAKLYANGQFLGDKRYINIDRMDSMASDGTGVVFHGSVRNISRDFTLSYASLTKDTGIADVMPDTMIPMYDRIMYQNGYMYYSNVTSGNIERIRHKDYIKDNINIKMIGAANYGSNTYSGGYSIEYKELSYDEFALTILSRDKSFDICYINSRLDCASNIRDKGSFYPLNDVPGVKEYIDASFPFIKDAAKNADGDIWMLPISVNVDAIVYHGENCASAGLDFENAKTVSDVIRNVQTAIAYDKKGQNFNFNGYALLQRSLIVYTRDNRTLDTPEFRTLAEELKTFFADDMFWWGNSMAEMMNNMEDFNPDFLFSTFHQQTGFQLINRNDLYITPLTGSGNKSSAYCVFLCVNPDSDNLQSTLYYISALCRYLSKLQNSCMLADPDMYTDSDYARRLYTLYENSLIDFNISDEILTNDFDSYLRDEITLDALITEGNRKLAMYRGE